MPRSARAGTQAERIGSWEFLAIVIAVAAFFSPQNLAAVTQSSSSTSDKASVSFTLDFPGSLPEHYSIKIDSGGKGTYSSGPSTASPGHSVASNGTANSTKEVKADADKASAASEYADSDADSQTTSSASSATNDPFEFEFNVSDTTRARIFDLASKAHFFEKNLDYGKHNLANTGAKTLAYTDGQRNSSSTFNYTTNQPAQELTTLFQNLSSTLEAGHRLAFLYQYQKLALEQELKRVEEMSKSGGLTEVQAIGPILKKISADSSVMNVTRARAQRLLAASASAN